MQVVIQRNNCSTISRSIVDMFEKFFNKPAMSLTNRKLFRYWYYQILNEASRSLMTGIISFFCGLTVAGAAYGIFLLVRCYILVSDTSQILSSDLPVFNSTRIFCWVMTQPKNKDKAKAIKATWGRRCDGLVFVSSVDDPELPSVNSEVFEGRTYLWGKTKFGFRYSYQHHFKDYDWFFKSDDDTYAIMENMKLLLAKHSPDEPVYFGSHFRKFIEDGYMSGGAGYVLSREAVRRFVQEGLDNKKCVSHHPHAAEDVETAKCMQKLGISPGESRDSFKRGRFFPFTPAKHVDPSQRKKKELQWYWNTLYYPEKEGMECCSEAAITFHYIKPEMMYEMEYLIYHLKPYGVRRDPLY